MGASIIANFLTTMGLPPGLAPRSLAARAEEKSLMSKVKSMVGLGPGKTEQKRQPEEIFYSRAQFEAGEVEELRQAFAARAKPRYEPAMTPGGAVSPVRVAQGELYELVKSLPVFEGIKKKDFDYVVEEAGYAKQPDLDFDEFVEVSASVALSYSPCELIVMFSYAPSSGTCCLRRHTTRKSEGQYPWRRAVVVYEYLSTHAREYLLWICLSLNILSALVLLYSFIALERTSQTKQTRKFVTRYSGVMFGESKSRV